MVAATVYLRACVHVYQLLAAGMLLPVFSFQKILSATLAGEQVVALRGHTACTQQYVY